MKHALIALAAWLRTLAALLLLVVLGRFVVVELLDRVAARLVEERQARASALGVDAASSAVAAARAASVGDMGQGGEGSMAEPGPGGAPLAASKPSSERKTRGLESGRNGNRDAVMTPFLLVQVEPPRSDVFVNGVLVGQTPYAGDVGCKPGTPLKVDVLPPKGAPKTFHVECRAGTVRVTERPATP